MRHFPRLGALLATIGGLAAVGALLAMPSPAQAQAAPARALTPGRSRITDQAIARDLATIDSVGRRLAAFDTVQAPERIYTRTQALGWLTLAREQYRLNDRSDLPEAAFARAIDLVTRLEAGQVSLDSLPADLPGAPRLRPDLRVFADSLRGSPALRCLAEPLARFELELVRSAHEKLVCRTNDPHPHGEALDRGAAELRALAGPCVPAIALAEPVAPAPVAPLPAPEPIPATPPPSEVTLQKLAALNSVHFDLNTETISAASAVELDSVAALLREAAGIRVALVGHTDPRGSAVYNMRLGRRRATAVRDYLARAGVDTARLSIVSFGKNILKAHGTGLRDYALNRRVEIQYSAPNGVQLEVHQQERDLQIERAAAPGPASAVRRWSGGGARGPGGSAATQRSVKKESPSKNATVRRSPRAPRAPASAVRTSPPSGARRPAGSGAPQRGAKKKPPPKSTMAGKP